MLNKVNNIIAVDLCNTVADINSELIKRLGDVSNPNIYFHPKLAENPQYFEENLEVFLEANVIDGSDEVLNYLSQFNKIVYITARPVISQLVTRRWLEENNFPKADIYFTNNKVDIAGKLNVNLAIEDSPYEIDRYTNHGIDVIVKKQQYNEIYFNRFDWKDIDYRRLISNEKE